MNKQRLRVIAERKKKKKRYVYLNMLINNVNALNKHAVGNLSNVLLTYFSMAKKDNTILLKKSDVIEMVINRLMNLFTNEGI